MFPELETHRLLLTKLQVSDAADVLALFSSEQVVEYFDFKVMTSLEEAEHAIQFLQQRYDSRHGIRWGIRSKLSARIIGTCGFNYWSQPMRSAVIGYDLHPAYWRQGLMSEALSAIIRHAFSGQLPCGEVNRIQADTVIGNARSEAVLNRLGFKEEGLRRECGYWKDAYHDLNFFGLLRREYDTASART